MRSLTHLLRRGLDRRHERIGIREHLVLQAQRMHVAHPFGHHRIGAGAHEGLHIGAVEREIGLRHPRRGRKAPLVLGVVAAERANVVERARLAAHHPVAGDEIGTGHVVRALGEGRLVKPGRQRIDQVDIVGEFAVLLARHCPTTRRFRDARYRREWCRRWSDRRSGSDRRCRRDRGSSPSACCGGVTLSPFEQNTTIGERMLRRSIAVPSEVLIRPAVRLLPTNNSSTMNWISSAFRLTCPPHQRSKPR